MKIALAADHAGWPAKETIKKFITRLGHKVHDFGTFSAEPVDYPDYTVKPARLVAARKFRFGIFLCGSGIGMSMVANKIKGIRSAFCHNKITARLARSHNDTNILSLGTRVLTISQMKQIIRVWLKTRFKGGRHLRRINKIKRIESGRK